MTVVNSSFLSKIEDDLLSLFQSEGPEVNALAIVTPRDAMVEALQELSEIFHAMFLVAAIIWLPIYLFSNYNTEIDEFTWIHAMALFVYLLVLAVIFAKLG